MTKKKILKLEKYHFDIIEKIKNENLFIFMEKVGTKKFYKISNGQAIYHDIFHFFITKKIIIPIQYDFFGDPMQFALAEDMKALGK